MCTLILSQTDLSPANYPLLRYLELVLLLWGFLSEMNKMQF